MEDNMFRVFNSTMAIVARKLSSRWSFLHSVTALVSLLPLLVASPLMAATKTLNIYNWVDYISPITLKDFEKKFNAKINYYNANPSSLPMVRKELVENLAVIPTAEVKKRMRLYASSSQSLIKERTKI